MTENIIYVRVKCDCGVNSFQVGFDKAIIPFDVYLCHCNNCRHVSGQMAFYHVPIIGEPFVGSLSPRPVDPKNDLTGYHTSPNSIRYFCAYCSAHMLRLDNTNWFVSGAVLESKEGIVRLAGHKHIADTMDGGVADQLRIVGGRHLPRFSHGEGSEEIPDNWRSKELKSRKEAKKDERLHAYCHCRSLDFYITRPSELSALPYAPYPDAICPVIQTRLATIRNAKDEKWWLSPSMRADDSGNLVSMETGEAVVPDAQTKYLAGHCVCPHCRLGSGFEVQSWSFVTRANMFEKGSAEPLELMHEPDRPACLKQYLSSPGKYREFCGTCGATCFWWHVGRPDVIDVSTGLLDQRENGVRAEDWLKWHKKRVSFIEKAKLSREVARGLVEGMASYQDPEEKI